MDVNQCSLGSFSILTPIGIVDITDVCCSQELAINRFSSSVIVGLTGDMRYRFHSLSEHGVLL